MRIDANLATRPFVNRTPQLALLAVLAAGAVGLTTWTGAVLARSHAERRAVEEQLDDLARDEKTLGASRQALQKDLAGRDLEPLALRVAAANDVLAQRAVSWSLLLERLEEILPWGASLESISSAVGEEGVTLEFAMRARTYDDALDFIDGLESAPCFADAYPENEERMGTEFALTVSATHDPYCGRTPPEPGGREMRRRGARRG